jgi:hypothetical protein
VAGAAQSSRMEIFGSGAKNFGHLSSAEVALSGGAAPRALTALKALDSGLQSVFTFAGHELRDQGLEPVGRAPQQLASCCPRGVEGGVSGSQQREPPVTGRLRICEREEGLGQRAVGYQLISHHRR